MKTKTKHRWTDFRKALPPVGVEIEVLAYRSWPEKDARCTMLVAIEGLDRGGIISFNGLDRSQFTGGLSRYSTCYHPEDARWRFVGSKVPGEREIAAGQRRIARLLRLEKQERRASALRAHRRELRRRAQQRRIDAMPVYRIRRVSCLHAGGSNYYHHADVIAPNWSAAMRAVREGRVENWRWIDTFDSSSQAYMEFEFLYRVDAPKRPSVPLRKAPKDWGKNEIPKLSHRRYLAFDRKVFGPTYPSAGQTAHS